MEDLLGHPIEGMSWEGYVIENLLAVMPERTGYRDRTSAGAEIDLVWNWAKESWNLGIEIKKSTAPKLERGFHLAVEDIQPNRVFHGLYWSGTVSQVCRYRGYAYVKWPRNLKYLNNWKI